jgi:hypothetical protein
MYMVTTSLMKILKFLQILEIFKFCENFQIYEIIWNSMKTDFFLFFGKFQSFR